MRLLPLKPLLCTLVLLAVGSRAVRAEFPALARALKPAIDKLTPGLAGKSVLISFEEPKIASASWNVFAAIETETLAQLLNAKIEAVDDDSDIRFQWLAKARRKPVLEWRKAPVLDVLIVGKVRPVAGNLRVTIEVHYPDKTKPTAVERLTINKRDAALLPNVPATNMSVANYMRANIGRRIGDGDGWTAPNEALKAFDCKRRGSYIWGRRLGADEAVLPGDVVQFESALFKGRRHKGTGVSLNHQSAVVDKVGPSFVSILQQNSGSAGKKVSALALSLDELVKGTVVFYRPNRGNSELPMAPLPLRKQPAPIARTPEGHIDLLAMIDPRLDSVRGIWGKWNGPLTSTKESFSRLQIPIEVPKSYVIRARIRRIRGSDGYVFVLIVGGRQCLLNIDGYGGDTTGLGMIDGKKEKQNETTQKLTLLPVGQTVNFEIWVTENSVNMKADGKDIVSWKGDPARLSLSSTWTVRNKERLHLGLYQSVFETDLLTIEPLIP